uniref:Uncharacterized protein n=1 Tax=Picea glauca TaxID=3330 RepID=A0A101M130_PICGL|nr:hypothetical protein ABT39_MTgene4418 [Picea glauca]
MVTIRSRPNHTCRSTYKRAKQHCWLDLSFPLLFLSGLQTTVGRCSYIWIDN